MVNEQSAQIIAHRKRPFPEGLEGRLSAILNVINTELKTLTMLHLDDVPVDGRAIKERIRETVGEGVYLPQGRGFANYNRKTLLPIGLVAEEKVIYEDPEIITIGYSLTEAGKKYGRPIAAFTLDYVFRNNQSMYSILGPTQSSGMNRSPFYRVGILELLRGKIKSEIDLASFGIFSGRGGLTGNLKLLNDIGFISFESCGEALALEAHNQFVFVWNQKDINQLKTVARYPTLTRRIAEKLQASGEATGYEIRKAVECASRSMVSTILSGLVEQGIVRRKRWKGGEVQSESRILERGTRFLEEYVDRVKDALKDGPSLREMNQLLERLFENPTIFEAQAIMAINLYKRVSPGINSRTSEEQQEKIVEYLRENPGKRPTEISRELPMISPYKYLTPLVRSGVLRKVKGMRGRTRYYINS